MPLVVNEKIANGLLKLIKNRCNSFLQSGSVQSRCAKFFIGGQQVGYVLPEFIPELAKYPKVFFSEKNSGEIHLNDEFNTYETRTKEVHRVLVDMRKKASISPLAGWRDEFYEVWINDQRQESLMKIERSASGIFGIVTYGAHINGYVNHSTRGLCVWSGKRSPTKSTYPNKWDQMAAGGVSVGLNILETARKECQEEASVPLELLNRLKSVGTVSYCYHDDDSDRGVIPGVEYCFDLELPEEFVPSVCDGEMSNFNLFSVQELLEVMVTDDFKPNCALVNLDFLIRQGQLEPDNVPYYSTIVQSLRCVLP